MYAVNDGFIAHSGDDSLEIYESIGVNPAVRIWGHYTTPSPGEISSFGGSAGGNGTYSGGTEWVELGYTWTIQADKVGYGLVVEARPYNSEPFEGSNWIDDICVTVPDHCFVNFPGWTPIANEDTNWSSIRTMYHWIDCIPIASTARP